MPQRKKIIGSFALLSALIIFSLAHAAAQSETITNIARMRHAYLLPAPTALPVQTPAPSSAYLITKTSVGPVRIGMTLAQARRAMPGVVFKRTAADAALFRGRTKLMKLFVYTNNSEKATNIANIVVFDASYSTAAGVHPKMLLREAEQRYGKVTISMGELADIDEQATFAQSPPGIYFFIDRGGKDHAGIYKGTETETKRYIPSAKIENIMIRREGE